MKQKPFYITTAIAYVNSEPHIGFLLELVMADVLARSARQVGRPTHFLTGTDEYGTKIALAAEERGQSPQEFVDLVANQYLALKKAINLSNDQFIRTTDLSHRRFVQNTWRQLVAKKLLEKRLYRGLYCVGCEGFLSERDLIDGLCPYHQKAPEVVEEENWFFKLSSFENQILDWLKTEPITPSSRLSEVEEFVKAGLSDVSFSRHRSKLSWGIPVPDDDSQVVYVWADALLNYLSAPAILSRDLWPADVQVIGKDILRFHAVIWPAMLLGLGLPLPRRLLAHGFITVDGQKMSKTLGNTITPKDLIKRYGIDGTRYLLLRYLNPLADSNFSYDQVDALYNGELANGIGNLVSRSLTLFRRFRDWGYQINWPKTEAPSPIEPEDLSRKLEELNLRVTAADSWISLEQPWRWQKDTLTQDQIDRFCRLIDLPKLAVVLEPYLPETSKNISQAATTLEPTSLFPRI